MRRRRVRLADIASAETLTLALWRAARGKRHRPEVRRFLERVDVELPGLQQDILAGRAGPTRFSSFVIHDPKPRQIHAPSFRDRVLHHAIMEHVGPVLDRALIADTFACRTGRGNLAAVHRAQQHVRRFPWYVQADVRRFFDRVRHETLKLQLRRRIHGAGALALLDRVIDGYAVTPGRGLPIGALTSQHFANHYLGPLDRFLAEELRVAALVRYMDDVVWWCRTKDEARATLARARAFVADALGVELKQDARVQRSARGLTFCGFRVLPGTLLLSRRRRRRYAEGRRRWERAYEAGAIDANALQAGYSSVLAITAHVDAAAWRREELRRRGTIAL